MDYSYLFYTILSLLAYLLFSGTSYIFASINPIEIALRKQQNDFVGKAVNWFYRQTLPFLLTTHFYKLLSLIGFVVGLSYLLPTYGLAARLLIALSVIFITNDIITKSAYRLFTFYRAISIVALPYSLFHALAIPIITPLTFFVEKIAAGFGIAPDEAQNTVEQSDLEDYIQEYIDTDTDPSEEVNLLSKAMALDNIKIKECMVPRTEIQAVALQDNLSTIVQKFIETKHSKLLVYDQTLDHVVGYLHHHDILQEQQTLNIGKKHKRHIWGIMIVPENMSAAVLLDKFIADRKNIALVVDEFGGTSGIVTLEDILEEIFGEIRDEHDDERLLERQISPNEYEFSARLEIDYLNEQYGLKISEGDYETLGGYIVAHHNSIPQNGEQLQIEGLTFTVLAATPTRVESVRLKKTE